MKKSVLILAGVLVIIMSMTIPAMAVKGRPGAAAAGNGYSYCGGYGIMWDEDGNFLDREAYERRLEEMIEGGEIQIEEKENYLEMYEWCTVYGGGGIRGGGGGRGRGCGIGRGAGRSW